MEFEPLPDNGVVPHLVKVRAGARGSGWTIGPRGVLTARHVVQPFLAGAVETCAAVPDPRPGARVYPCTVVWEDSGSDLALLRVRDEVADDWAAQFDGRHVT